MRRILLASFLLAASVPSASAEVFLSCDIQAVGSFGNRVHVLCDQPYTGTSISYFATPASDPAMASRMASIALVSQVTGAFARIYFDLGDTSGASFGCQASDCRKIQGIEVHGVGPLVASAGARKAAALAAITVPEPSGEYAALAVGAAIVSLRAGRRILASG